MQRLIRLAAAATLLSGGVSAKGSTPASPTSPALRRNLAATEARFAGLLDPGGRGTLPDGAALNLLLTMMPKGADLHHHYSGAQYAETYLDTVERSGFCIYGESDASLQAEKFRIETRPQLPESAARICRKADAVRRDTTFYRELLERWSNKDFANHAHAQPPPDQQFFDTFGYFWQAANQSQREGLLLLKERAKAENVQYLESMLKGAPDLDHPELARQLDGLAATASDEEIQAALAACTDFLSRDPGTQQRIAEYVRGLEALAAGLDDDGFKLRFQAYASRNNAPSQVFAGLYAAFAATRESRLVVGVNFVGPENGPVALRDYRLHMRMLHHLRHAFPAARLALHAGELALGMVPPEALRFHIREAVEIAGADRIGHGVDVSHEAGAIGLLERMREKPVAVEVNLTSNEFILGVKDSAHPVQLYLRAGVPVVISTDDPGVSRSSLAGEYLLFVSRYRPTYRQLKEIVFDGLRHSFLPAPEKEEELRGLAARFERFEAEVERSSREEEGRKRGTSRPARRRRD
jgi:adenosine deaminase/adenosine deaminase CECR1